MIANIIIVTVLIAWAVFALKYLTKDKKEAKKAGIPTGCCGCMNYKDGTCQSHSSQEKTSGK